jgi:hypothetical protein
MKEHTLFQDVVRISCYVFAGVLIFRGFLWSILGGAFLVIGYLYENWEDLK